MNRQIIRLAIPNIISNITIPLLGMVDLAIVGRLGDDFLLGGIAIGGAIFNFIYWNFGFLRMGTSGFTSQAFGRGDTGECSHTLSRALSVALLVAAAMLMLQLPIVNLAQSVMGSDPQAMIWARQYFLIRIWAAPATLSLYVTTGWFIGMQNAKTPMWIAILINIINVTLSWLLAMPLGMGIQGVALGTVVAQWSGALLSLYLIWRMYPQIRGHRPSLSIFGAGQMRAFFKVNGNIFIRTTCLVWVFTFITWASTRMGNDILSANTLLLQLFTLFSYMMDGFAYAIEALSGKYFGAGDRGQLRRSVKVTLLWGAALSLFFTVIYAVLGHQILSIFTSSRDILAVADEFLIWGAAIPLAGFGAFLLDGVMVGISASAIMRNAMLISTAIFFGLYFALGPGMGNDAIWIAFLAFLLSRGVVQFMMSFKLIFSRNSGSVNVLKSR